MRFCFLVISLRLFVSCTDGDKTMEVSKKEGTSTSSATVIAKKDSVVIQNTSIITCPKCKTSKEEVMPTETCKLSYICTKCSYEMHPQNGDCCVFCTYGDHKCPSMQ